MIKTINTVRLVRNGTPVVLSTIPGGSGRCDGCYFFNDKINHCNMLDFDVQIRGAIVGVFGHCAETFNGHIYQEVNDATTITIDMN